MMGFVYFMMGAIIGVFVVYVLHLIVLVGGMIPEEDRFPLLILFVIMSGLVGVASQ